jgi:hypothetical protein
MREETRYLRASRTEDSRRADHVLWWVYGVDPLDTQESSGQLIIHITSDDEETQGLELLGHGSRENTMFLGLVPQPVGTLPLCIF